MRRLYNSAPANEKVTLTLNVEIDPAYYAQLDRVTTLSIDEELSMQAELDTQDTLAMAVKSGRIKSFVMRKTSTSLIAGR